jgi:tellurite methyltransferase
VSIEAGPAGSLRELLGDIDVYLVDQLMRGRIAPGMRILDAGCGGGRNVEYLMRAGYDVSGTDQSPAAVDATRKMAMRYAPHLALENFRVERVEQSSFEPRSFDFIISSAVLHFARNEAHFHAMVDEMWRLLRPGGTLFARLASTIGMPLEAFRPLGDRRFAMPDRSERFLVDEHMLMATTNRLGGVLLDPIKTTVVQNARCMTTWVIGSVTALEVP